MSAIGTALRQAAAPRAVVGILMAREAEAIAAVLAAEEQEHPAVLLPGELSPGELHARLDASPITHLFVPPLAATHLSSDLRPTIVAGWNPIPPPLHPGSLPNRIADVVNALWIGQFSSGSLSTGRLVVRTWPAVCAEIAAVSERLALTADDTILCTPEWAYSYALIGGILAPLLVGARVIVPAPPGALLRSEETLRPTVIVGLARDYRTLLASKRAEPVLRRTRLALSAGAPLPAGLNTDFTDRFGLPIRQDYGTTETGTISIDTAGAGVPGCVGPPLPHLAVRLQPLDHLLLEPGETGEIQVRAPAVAAGYLVNGDLFPCVDREGWYQTRDEGSVDAAGRLHLGRRLRDPIMVNGRAVYPDTIERALRRLAGVQEVVVLPVHQHGTTLVKAVLVAPAVTPAMVHAWCREHLVAEDRPSIVELRGALPRSAAGKILQKYLR